LRWVSVAQLRRVQFAEYPASCREEEAAISASQLDLAGSTVPQPLELDADLTESRPGDRLAALDLPAAPPVTRAAAAPMVRPKLLASVLLCFGVLLTVAPIVGGLFSKVAAGKQMIDEFAPYMSADTLARYDGDIGVMRNGATGVDAVYANAHVAAGRFPGLDTYRLQAAAIDHRASSLLARVTAARPDYEKVAGIGGFDRIPFLIVVCGAVAIYGGCVLRFGLRRRAVSTVLLVIVASVAVALYPFISNFESGAAAGRRMLSALSPVMTAGQVRQLQADFIVLVTAVGELDTTFTGVHATGPAAVEIHTLVEQWPSVSSDFASLIGTIEDNISNFRALEDLDSLTNGIGVSGLEAFPWLLVGIGAASATASIAALPRRRKDSP
jgi:hypothetical protein